MENSFINNLALLLVRLGFSAAMLTHGIPKMMKLFKGDFSFADPFGIGAGPSLGLAVFGEVVAPILIIVGLKTRLAAIPAAITMAVAAFMVHGDDPFAKQEKALLYLIAFVAIGLLGAGKFSVDGILKKS